MGGAAVEERVEGEGGGLQQCLRCGLSDASCRPGPPRPHPPSHQDGEEKADQEVGGGLCRKERRRLALLVFNSQGPGPAPPSPFLLRTQRTS
ncbi:hypothetical protein KUCAC02_027404 [Chaenocephalus aceratus]|uniref:Uncharacterized protein n=1 Tax=Chaenocephalus aceratus TaxID=36190 RepID=A0ACB9W499_CHAAC|nr:hypothetical protein KUCAC02_027404 [Chaenocephalus aceratus]